MKRSLLICLLIWSRVAIGQKMESFSLSGTINLDSGNIQFLEIANPVDYTNNLINTSVPVKSGKFLLEGKIAEPVKLRLAAKVSGSLIYISAGFYLQNR